MDFGSGPMVLGLLAVVAVAAMNITTGASRRRLLHDERMAALDKGVPLPEDLLVAADADGKQNNAARNAAMQGTIWTAIGLGMMAASRFVEHSEFGSEMRQVLAFLEIWAYPATFVGIGLLVFAFFTREKKS
jgi:hypothetical protein